MMKKTSRFNFCSMSKTKKLVILPSVSKSSEKERTQFMIFFMIFQSGPEPSGGAFNLADYFSEKLESYDTSIKIYSRKLA